jgi:hypothetical protein
VTEQELADARRTERVLEEVTEGAFEPMEVETAPERTRETRTPGFSRMRLNWQGPERATVDFALTQASTEVLTAFSDAYRIMNRLYEVVREPLVNIETGEVIVRDGYAVWAKDEFDMPKEDWSRLTERDKESFLHQITTRLFTWEQRAADFWLEAMLAKGQWEERFAILFTGTSSIENKRPTVEDRTQNGHLGAREERYLAIFLAARSRKAEALVKSMDRIAQRLKDTSR